MLAADSFVGRIWKIVVYGGYIVCQYPESFQYLFTSMSEIVEDFQLVIRIREENSRGLCRSVYK